jgi:hypothetical protein
MPYLGSVHIGVYKVEIPVSLQSTFEFLLQLLVPKIAQKTLSDVK